MEALKESDILGIYYELYEILRSNESIATAIQCYTKCKMNHSLIVKHLDIQKFTYISECLEFVYNNTGIVDLKEIVIYKKINDIKAKLGD